MQKLIKPLSIICVVMLLVSCTFVKEPAEECKHEWTETTSLIGTVTITGTEQSVGDYIIVSRTCSKCGVEGEPKYVSPSLGLAYSDVTGGVAVSIGECTDSVVYIPQSINDNGVTKTVVAISDFYESKIKEIYIPETVESIVEEAFGFCYLLGSVSIPEGATIGDYCFEDCYALKSVKLPSALTTIPNCCFINCYNLQEITPESKLNLVNDVDFENCYFLLP